MNKLSTKSQTIILEAHNNCFPDMDVWSLVGSDRESLTKLASRFLKDWSLGRRLRWSERLYLKALLMARWDRITSPLVLRVLAPMVKKMLKALGRAFEAPLTVESGAEAVDRDAVKGVLSLMGDSAYRIVRQVAERLSGYAQSWGNRLARKWLDDAGFICYLTMMSLPQNRNLYAPFTITV